jgi:hypothetical protein
MNRTEVFYVLIGLAAFMLGMYYVRVFPDPYHQNGLVNIYTWITREIDELLHGEKPIP